MRGLGDPESGLSYPELLRRGDDAAANALRGLLGAVTCVLLYTVLVPLVSFGLSAVGWLASGAPGEFAAYYAAGRAMEFPWGMVSAHLGLATLIVVGLGCVVADNHLRPRWLCSVQPGFRWRYA
ncbi:MAG: CPBP family intramembrane metalloprotease, partial [Propionibacteriaceae bacterium]|nr:CPBP family intramembrane metalloprotease [Propionibacteriaceae bacterium]